MAKVTLLKTLYFKIMTPPTKSLDETAGKRDRIHYAHMLRFATIIEMTITTGYTSRRVAELLRVREVEVSRALTLYYKKEKHNLILKSKV